MLLRREYLREIAENHIGSKALLQVVEEYAGDNLPLVRRALAAAAAAVGTGVPTCTHRTGQAAL